MRVFDTNMLVSKTQVKTRENYQTRAQCEIFFSYILHYVFGENGAGCICFSRFGTFEACNPSQNETQRRV